MTDMKEQKYTKQIDWRFYSITVAAVLSILVVLINIVMSRFTIGLVYWALFVALFCYINIKLLYGNGVTKLELVVGTVLSLGVNVLAAVMIISLFR